MAVLAHHQQQARAVAQGVEVHLHAELLARVLEQRVQRGCAGQLRRRLEVHPHEEVAGGVFTFEVTELLRVDDVAAGLVEQARDRVHDALGVAAGKGEDKLVVRRHRPEL